MAMEMEDDVFFADLSKQIALLIMDDDEEEFPVQTPPVVHVQGFHHMPQAMMPPPYYIYENYDQMSYRRESESKSKGTGVFIPRSSIPRRKNRTGKSSSINNSSQRQLHDKSAGVVAVVSRATSNDRLQSNYCKSSGSLKNRT